jgi:hypothetical protein
LTAVNSREFALPALLMYILIPLDYETQSNIARLNLMFPETVPDPDLLAADPTRMMIIAVDHPVDTALAATPTVTEAHLAVVDMTIMTAEGTVLHREPVAPLMTIHLHVVASMILTVAITHLTHTSMAMEDLLMIDHLQEITHQEKPRMPMTIVAVTGKYSNSGYISILLTYCRSLNSQNGDDTFTCANESGLPHGGPQILS